MGIAMVTWLPLNSGLFGSGEANTEAASVPPGRRQGRRAEAPEVVGPEGAGQVSAAF